MSIEANTQLLQQIKARLEDMPAQSNPAVWQALAARTIEAMDLTGISNIRSRAFKGCARLSLSEIPSNIAAVGKEAFYQCTGLTKLKIKCGIINENAFYGCTGLTKVWISKNDVNTIYASSNTYAPFYGCSSALILYTDASSSSSVPSGWASGWKAGNGIRNTFTVKYGTSETAFDAL